MFCTHVKGQRDTEQIFQYFSTIIRLYHTAHTKLKLQQTELKINAFLFGPLSHPFPNNNKREQMYNTDVIDCSINYQIPSGNLRVTCATLIFASAPRKTDRRRRQRSLPTLAD